MLNTIIVSLMKKKSHLLIRTYVEALIDERFIQLVVAPLIQFLVALIEKSEEEHVEIR